MARRSSPRPRLTPDLVRDEQRLWEALNEPVLRIPGYRDRSRRVVRDQRKLQALVSDAAWSLYLRLEAETNARHEIAITALVAWAFEQGRRSGIQQRGAT